MAGVRETAVRGSCHYNSQSLSKFQGSWLVWWIKYNVNCRLQTQEKHIIFYQVCLSQFGMASVMDVHDPERKRAAIAVQTHQKNQSAVFD